MIVDYINSHQAEFWIFAGFALLAIEVSIGLSTGLLLFGGLGALGCGLAMLMGVLPETWTAGVAGTGILTAVITAALWVPFRRMQGGRAASKDNTSDLVGLEFVAEQDIDSLHPGRKKYSGLEWRVELDRHAGVDRIDAGQHVVVTSVDVAVFRVKPLS